MAKPKRMTELKEQVNKVYQEFREAKRKRGKDIKCFADLPPDVQENINRTSDSEQERKLRPACAIHYQNMSPDRFNSTGVAV